MKRQFIYFIILACCAFFAVMALNASHSGFNASRAEITAPQWQEVELSFEASQSYDNPYTDVEVAVVFTHSDGEQLKRPAFWDGGNVWRVRFASPTAEGQWSWRSVSSNSADTGLNGLTGQLQADAYGGNDPLVQHGLLRMSAGDRNIIHADGTPFLVVGDTPWALPFRGTEETVMRYAENRQERGFNTALLMSVQPDREAEGSRDRTAIGSFGVAFEDLAAGQLNQINVEYFQTLDTLITILLGHGIVPAYNPVFQGFGWKGLSTLGAHADPREYARYTRYLIARYGARPALWLIGADGRGSEPTIEPGGLTTEEWDAYGQPTGLHYSPFDSSHQNRAYQSAEWLDFQWAQTGHNAEHLIYKVEAMYDNQPPKAIANGEPTYERIGSPTNATGWWQGHEAWLNVTSGGTMGHVYGAGGLWNWKLAADESGWPDWANTQSSWSESIEFEGSRYVGYLSRAFEGLDFADIERRHDLAGGKLALAKPGQLYIVYLPEGGEVNLSGLTTALPYRWFDPQTGEWADSGTVQAGSGLVAPSEAPWVLIAAEKTP
ncbi:MAG: DUF4038 domain-containing protein [Elainellaceae cyanobacterium]